MDKKFTSNDIPLSDLLNQAHVGELQLPDFQRGWVWDDDHIKSLLASVSLSYPIGAVMTLRTGNPLVAFLPRLMQGAPDGAAKEPDFLLLDGQQRTTSLYLALRSGQAVPTRDTRGDKIDRRYFADIRACIDPWADREDAILSVPADGRRTVRGRVDLDVSTVEAQVEAQMFPLDIVLDQSATWLWAQRFLDPQIPERMQVWTAFLAAVVTPFTQYRVPTIELSRTTPKEAVCQVFEKVNTGGVSLTVFELLTATFAADGFSLRDDWAHRRRSFAEHDLLEAFPETAFLQVITLLATRGKRNDALVENPSDERPPAISGKRRDMLRLTLGEYRAWADLVTPVLPRVVRFLEEERILLPRDLPYATQLVPLTAILTVLGDTPLGGESAGRLRRWFWCGVFGELYGGSTETRIANDLQDVLSWLAGGSEPRTVIESQFQASRLLTLRTRNSAAYKGLTALLLKAGSRDFRTNAPFDRDSYGKDIDLWYVFPPAWAKQHDIPDGDVNSIVNRMLIDNRFGRRLVGAPAQYLDRLASFVPGDVDDVVSSHDIDPVALRADDFPAFFIDRFERLLRRIEEVTGKPVNRTVDGFDNPYAAERAAHVSAAAIRRIIDSKESQTVEFKSTAFRCLNTGLREDYIELGALKSIAAFLNTDGGTLLIGVTDDYEVCGIEEDFRLFNKAKRSTDAWDLRFTALLTSHLGRVPTTQVTLSYTLVDGKTVARAEVKPAAHAVFVRAKDGKQPFYVRINASTQELIGAEMYDYQRNRFPS